MEELSDDGSLGRIGLDDTSDRSVERLPGRADGDLGAIGPLAQQGARLAGLGHGGLGLAQRRLGRGDGLLGGRRVAEQSIDEQFGGRLAASASIV